jgi:hypothetical protein
MSPPFPGARHWYVGTVTAVDRDEERCACGWQWSTAAAHIASENARDRYPNPFSVEADSHAEAWQFVWSARGRGWIVSDPYLPVGSHWAVMVWDRPDDGLDGQGLPPIAATPDPAEVDRSTPAPGSRWVSKARDDEETTLTVLVAFCSDHSVVGNLDTDAPGAARRSWTFADFESDFEPESDPAPPIAIGSSWRSTESGFAVTVTRVAGATVWGRPAGQDDGLDRHWPLAFFLDRYRPI